MTSALCVAWGGANREAVGVVFGAFTVQCSSLDRRIVSKHQNLRSLPKGRSAVNGKPPVSDRSTADSSNAISKVPAHDQVLICFATGPRGVR